LFICSKSTLSLHCNTHTRRRRKATTAHHPHTHSLDQLANNDAIMSPPIYAEGTRPALSSHLYQLISILHRPPSIVVVVDPSMAEQLDLPGFRFHPTEEELLEFYLKQAAHGRKLKFDIIPTVHLYRHDPWELPGLARIGEREWYFFVPRDGGRPAKQHHHQSSGARPSRTTERGFWKATGSDRAVRCAHDPKRLIGLKKTLVYYEGRAPRGTKTDWVMNEYRLPDACNNNNNNNNAVAGDSSTAAAASSTTTTNNSPKVNIYKC
jgi:hypothetical protein